MKNSMKKIVIVVFVMLTFFSVNTLGIIIENPIANPAAKYCKDLGYEWYKEQTAEGEIGICSFPDGSSAEDWDFLKGKIGQEWSYCKQRGLEIKILTNHSKCLSIYSLECSACVLENGTEVEVTSIMELEVFEKGKCGNGICEINENYDICPDDCPIVETQNLEIIIYALAFVVIVAVLLLYIVRSRKSQTEKYF